MPYSVINAAFNLSVDTAHKLATVADGRTVLFEVDHYPSAATPRPADAGRLPQGVSMIAVRVSQPPKNAHWLMPPSVRTHAPYFGATVGVIRGLDDELLEIIW
jgi:hypothetical protein